MTRRLRRLSQELDVILKTRRRPGERWQRKDGSQWTKLADGNIVPLPASEKQKTGMFGEERAAVMAEKTARKTCLLLASVLESGKSATVKNKELGDITVDAGHTGKNGYGLKHIIEQRYKKDGKNDAEITALISLVKDAAQQGKVSREIKFANNPEHKGRIELEKNGVIAIVSKQRLQGDDEQWLLTGFDDKNKEEEATDAIQTVIAQYGYTPEFYGFRRQVGAVIASLKLSHNTVKKSREQAEGVVKFWLKIYKLYEKVKDGTAS